MDKELKEALYADYVEILKYSDSTISFRAVDNCEGFYSIYWLLDTASFFKPFNVDKIFTAKLFQPIENKQQNSKDKTGYWPAIGEKVLIVLRANGTISLFADKQGNNYRFWSPELTGSQALFCFKTPAIKLTDKEGLSDMLGLYETCWDGCLLPIEFLTTYAHIDEKRIFTGQTIMSGGEALFIDDFSDSEPYFLDGIKIWEEKYSIKRLKVEGILIQFIEGKSVIKDWKIISIE